MSEPTLNLATPIQTYSQGVAISTATTNENVLANKAGSGKKVRIDYLAFNNADGSAAANVRAQIFDQDGTGMNSDDGYDGVAIGADVVAGAAIFNLCPLDMEVAAKGGQIVIDDRNPYEMTADRSLVIRASAAGDIDVVFSWTVIG